MKRDVQMIEISDGKLYGPNDMVKAGCMDCKGCHACCCGMGNSIELDPMDVARLTRATGKSMMELLNVDVSLSVIDGLILPSLLMKGEKERCSFLNEEGRCSIHEYRPGICRLFPLGRYYTEDGFRYFLQIHECRLENRTKVKVKKWVDTPDLARYDAYIVKWHNVKRDLEDYISLHQDLEKSLCMDLLNRFFMENYDLDHFYEDFEKREADFRTYYSLSIEEHE